MLVVSIHVGSLVDGAALLIDVHEARLGVDNESPMMCQAALPSSLEVKSCCLFVDLTHNLVDVVFPVTAQLACPAPRGHVSDKNTVTFFQHRAPDS